MNSSIFQGHGEQEEWDGSAVKEKLEQYKCVLFTNFTSLQPASGLNVHVCCLSKRGMGVRGFLIC